MNLSLILIGLLGLFVISLMLFAYRTNVFVNIYLVLIFILCSIRSIIIGVFESTDFNLTIPVEFISPLYLIIVPALYLYFKSLVKDYDAIYRKDLIHLLFPTLNLVLNFSQEYFSVLDSPFVRNIRFLSLTIYFLLYLFLSYNVLFKNLWKKGVNLSVNRKHYVLIKNWTLFLFIISSFLFLRIIYSIYSEKVINELFQAKNYSFLVIIPWLLIYGKILISPEILYGYPKLKKRVAEIQNQVSVNNKIWIYNSIRISNIQDKKLSTNINKRVIPYISDIENFVNKEQPFRNSKSSFSDFAKKINIPASHIIYIFKYHCNITFGEYKNYCRIKDALNLINEGYLDNLTLEGLASKVGFSSYNSFYTAFKKHTQLAPKTYLISLNNTNPQSVTI